MSVPTIPPAPARRLIGVGVGPGDPELITVKAVHALRGGRRDPGARDRGVRRRSGAGGADRVEAACPSAAPRSSASPSPWPTSRGRPRRKQAWLTSAEAAVDAFDAALRPSRSPPSATRASTPRSPTWQPTSSSSCPTWRSRSSPASPRCRHWPPASRTPLVEGQEVLALVPVTAGTGPPPRARARHRRHHRRLQGRAPSARGRELLRREERDAVWGCDDRHGRTSARPTLGAGRRRVHPVLLSTVLAAARRRSTTGGRL